MKKIINLFMKNLKKHENRQLLFVCFVVGIYILTYFMIKNINDNILLSVDPVTIAAGIAAGTEAAAGTTAAGATAAGATAAGATAAGASAEAGATTASATAAGASAEAGTTTGTANAAVNTANTVKSAPPKAQTVNVPNKSKVVPKNDDALKNLKQKPKELNEATSKSAKKEAKTSEVQKEKKESKKHRMDLDMENKDEEEEEGEGLDPASKEVLNKNTILGCLSIPVLIAIGAFVLIVILPILFNFIISPTSKMVNGFSCEENSTSVLCATYNGIKGFFEKSKNFYLFGIGYFANDTDVLVKKTESVYETYWTKYDVQIDIPLLLSSILSDGYTSNGEIVVGDNIDVKSNLIARFDNIDELAQLQFNIYETKYECILDEDGSPSMNAVSRTVLEGEKKAVTSCGTTNVGEYVYRYSYQLDLDDYYDKLKENVDILADIYGEDMVATESDVTLLISKIKLQKNLFDAFYRTEEDICSSPGNIPSIAIEDIGINLQTPLKGVYNITSYYGLRILKGKIDNHRGIDVIGNETIYAAGDGVVTKAHYEVVGGYVVEVKHTTSDGRVFYSQYAHLKSMSVSVGDTVVAGTTVIGIMGKTGTGATGVHLHFQFWEVLADGEIEYYNPLTIFVGAENYIYQCIGTDLTSDTCVSTSGSIAYVSENYGYNYYLLQAIFATTGAGETSQTKNDINLTGDFSKYLQTKYQTGTFEQKDVIALVNTTTEKVYLDGEWVDYTGSDVSAYEIRARMIEMLGEVDPEIYEYIYMGVAQLRGDIYETIGYTSAEAMYEAWSDSHHKQITDTIYYLTSVLGDDSDILEKSDLTYDELQSAALKIAAVLFGDYSDYVNNNYAKNIVYNYNEAQKTAPTLEAALNDCTDYNDVTYYDGVKGEQCEMYVSYSECKENIETYDNDSYWGRFIKQASSSLTRVRLLNAAYEYWGYVRYCNSSTISRHESQENNEYFYPCKQYTSAWNGADEFSAAWSILVGPLYGDVISGLDCGGYISRVLNTFIRRYYDVDDDFSMTYVLHDTGYCRVDSEYTTHTDMEMDATEYFLDSENTLKPGDVLCDTSDGTKGNSIGNHAMMFIGWDDDNSNGVWDSDERFYVIHSYGWNTGIMITSYTLAELDESHYYQHYFTINDVTSSHYRIESNTTVE